MALKTRVFVAVVCDGCGAVSESNEGIEFWREVADACDAARDGGWLTDIRNDPRDDLCPKCYCAECHARITDANPRNLRSNGAVDYWSCRTCMA